MSKKKTVEKKSTSKLPSFDKTEDEKAESNEDKALGTKSTEEEKVEKAPRKRKTVRPSVYEYPDGLSSDQKKKFRSEARAAEKRATRERNKSEAAPKKAKATKSQTAEEATPSKAVKSKELKPSKKSNSEDED